MRQRIMTCLLPDKYIFFLGGRLLLYTIKVTCRGLWRALCGPAASLMADQPTGAVNFTNDFSMVFNSPFWRRGNVKADGKVNVTLTH